MAKSDLELMADLAKKKQPTKIHNALRLEIGDIVPKYLDEVVLAMGVLLTISARRGKWQAIAWSEIFAFCREWRINLIDVQYGINVIAESEDLFLRNVSDLGACIIMSQHLAGQLQVIQERRQVFYTEKNPIK